MSKDVTLVRITAAQDKESRVAEDTAESEVVAGRGQVGTLRPSHRRCPSAARYCCYLQRISKPFI